MNIPFVKTPPNLHLAFHKGNFDEALIFIKKKKRMNENWRILAQGSCRRFEVTQSEALAGGEEAIQKTVNNS